MEKELPARLATGGDCTRYAVIRVYVWVRECVLARVRRGGWARIWGCPRAGGWAVTVLRLNEHRPAASLNRARLTGPRRFREESHNYNSIIAARVRELLKRLGPRDYMLVLDKLPSRREHGF